MSTGLNVKLLYEKFVNGDSLSNREVLDGYFHFRRMASDLVQSGPVFKLAATEAFRVADTLKSYADSRNLNTDPF